MSGWVKDWTRNRLADICRDRYGIKIDAQGQWRTTEDKLIKWAIRDSKPLEPWVFSITAAMALGACLEKRGDVVALEMTEALNDTGLSAWRFKSQGAYINAFFLPMTIQDYLSHKARPDWLVLAAFQDGLYARYRLELIKSALQARGVAAATAETPLTDQAKRQLKPLMNYPDRAPKESDEARRHWEIWLSAVCCATQQGDLRALDEQTERLLLYFTDACLNG